jgi:hypothetical protein
VLSLIRLDLSLFVARFAFLDLSTARAASISSAGQDGEGSLEHFTTDAAPMAASVAQVNLPVAVLVWLLDNSKPDCPPKSQADTLLADGVDDRHRPIPAIASGAAAPVGCVDDFRL